MLLIRVYYFVLPSLVRYVFYVVVVCLLLVLRRFYTGLTGTTLCTFIRMDFSWIYFSNAVSLNIAVPPIYIVMFSVGGCWF